MTMPLHSLQPRYALVTLCNDEVSPRFDLTAEVLICPLLPDAETAGLPEGHRHLVLAHVSGEELCDVITRSGVSVVVCGGIEEDYFHYLRWKRIEVISDVMGPAAEALCKLARGELNPGDCLFEPAREEEA